METYMKPSRIFQFLDKIYKCKTRIQLPDKSAKKLIDLDYVKPVNHQENWSLGIFTCIFHELTEKGIIFYKNYCIKNKIN